MIDAMKDPLIPLANVAAKFPAPSGKRRSMSSLIRWVKKGVDGVRLEAVRVGGSWYTTEEAVNRFIQSPEQCKAAAETNEAQTESHKRATAKLAAAGL